MQGDPYFSSALKNATNIFRHGEVTALPFGNPGNFMTIYLAPKSGTADVKAVIVDCMMVADKVSSGLPVKPEDWSAQSITSIPNSAANASLLTNYRVFWASGETSPLTI